VAATSETGCPAGADRASAPATRWSPASFSSKLISGSGCNSEAESLRCISRAAVDGSAVSIEEVEVGAADSGGDPPFRPDTSPDSPLIPRKNNLISAERYLSLGCGNGFVWPPLVGLSQILSSRD
jgi:hypothetical protein